MKKSLLLIDDDVNLLSLAVMHLEEHFRITTAENGEEALALARSEKPDAIVLDMMLPRMSGAEFLQELKKDDGTRAIPVIVLSAFNFSEEEAAEIESEPNVKGLLRKPFNFDRLRERILSAARVAATP